MEVLHSKFLCCCEWDMVNLLLQRQQTLEKLIWVYFSFENKYFSKNKKYSLYGIDEIAWTTKDGTQGVVGNS